MRGTPGAGRRAKPLDAQLACPDYRRAVALLAGSDGRTDPLAYVTRAAREACGALIVVLMLISSAQATPAVVRAYGRSATRVGRKLAALGADWLATSLRVTDAAGYRILVVPVTTPVGVAGALAVGVRPPHGFSAQQRQHLRGLADIASVALQLAAVRPPALDPAPALEHGPRPLNRREREVVTLLLAGASVKEAAARLDISPRTVETYLQRLKQRERQPRLHALLAQLVRAGRA